MSNYLNNLIARAAEPSAAVRPRLASLFEPPATAAGVMAGPLGGSRHVKRSRGAATFDERRAVSRPAVESPRAVPADKSPDPTADPVVALRRERQVKPLRESPIDISPAESSDKLQTKQRAARPESNPGRETRRPTSDDTRIASIETQPHTRGRRDDRPDSSSPLIDREESQLEERRTPGAAEIGVAVNEIAFTYAESPQPAAPESNFDSEEAGSYETPVVIVRPKPVRVQEERSLPPTPIAAVADSSPAIRISIGRVDVRAIMPPAQQPSRSVEPQRRSGLSLDEYLKQRNGAKS